MHWYYPQLQKSAIWQAVKATHLRHFASFVALNAMFAAYVAVVTILRTTQPGPTEDYLEAARSWIDWIGGAVPYLETKVRKISESRYPYRTELVRHTFTVLWIQIYLTLAVALPFLKSIAESVADRLGTSKSEVYKVGVAVRFAPVGVLICWAVWAMFGTSGIRPGFRTYPLDGSLIGTLSGWLMAAMTSWYAAFVIVCIRVRRIWRRTGVEPQDATPS